jgi:trehalose-phosphatase
LGDKIKDQGYAVQQATRSTTVTRRSAEPGHLPRHLLHAWSEVKARILAADRRALFLDFDGTLVKLRRDPDAVQLSKRTKATLERLARRENLFVALVSGRSLRFLQTLVGGNRIACIGVYGGESKEKSIELSKKARRALLRAKRIARLQLHDFPKVWIEDKRLSFAVHYRGASRATAVAADLVLRGILAPMRDILRVMNGNKVWEVIPCEIEGKGGAVRALLDGLPGKTLAICIGDDTTDEAAFAVLADHITVKVGRIRDTHAHFYLRNPTEVQRFLFRLEKDLP